MLVADPDTSPKVYVDSQTPVQDVEQALLKAKLSDKNLIVVMGAQWCHDSRGLASQFASKEMLPVLEQYEVTYVDVGYYKDLRAISERFGLAHYFATPTVMIINPQTQAVVNTSDMHIWGSADSIPQQEYIDYFTEYASKSESTLPEVSAEHLKVIQKFQSDQANRLMLGYTKLIPGLENDDESEEFFDQWRQVRKFRTKLQTDIFALYEQASENPDSTLNLPQYQPFSWEEL
jgi:thiol-disulfide isomerase/thioredoxin